MVGVKIIFIVELTHISNIIVHRLLL